MGTLLPILVVAVLAQGSFAVPNPNLVHPHPPHNPHVRPPPPLDVYLQPHPAPLLPTIAVPVPQQQHPVPLLPTIAVPVPHQPHPVPPPHPQPHPVPYPVPHVLPPPPLPSSAWPPAFPQSFSFGVTSGAYHIEGAHDEDGSLPSVWDHWLHRNPGVVLDASNGDFSADAYHHLEDDVEILNNLTVRHYIFSISWSRILTECGEQNKAGIKHYQRLLQLLKENQIEPMIILNDGDLPQHLQNQGGFLNEFFPDWFTEYSRNVFELFGKQVKYFITFNNPVDICNGGYGDGTFAPGISDNAGVNDYICGHNLLKAHANAYHLYDDHFRHQQKGKISMALGTAWYEPDTDCHTDIEAAETKLQFQLGWFAHPIYQGDYPQAMIDRVGLVSELQGLCTSRLPVFTRKEVEWIKDTHDFFSLNFQQSWRVRALRSEPCLTPSYSNDVGVELDDIEGDVTFGMRKLIIWIKKSYLNPSIFITSDRYGTLDRDCNDNDRAHYIRDVLVNIRSTMVNDDARVYGYSYNSYIDGFEWTKGYTVKYGLYDVEFDCSTKPRTARKSAEYYQFVCKYGCISDPCPPRHHRPAYADYVL